MRRSPWLILFVAWLGWVFDIMDTALFNFAKTPMLQSLMPGLDSTAIAPFEGKIQTCFIVGWAVGGLVFGVMADRWGRTRTMALTIFLYAIFTGITAFCQTWEQVAAIRFLTALGIGGEWAAGAALVAESFEDDFRPMAAAVLQTAAAFGPWGAALLNWAILGHLTAGDRVGGFLPWQWLFLAGVAPALAAFVVRYTVPEPPRKAQFEQAGEGGVVELFSTRRWALLAIGILFVGAVGIAGAWNATFWLPNLVQDASAGLSSQDVAGRKSMATLIMHVGTLAGVFLFPYVAKRYGRKVGLAIGFVGAFLCTSVALRSQPTYEALLGIAPLIAFFAIGVTAIFGLYFPELFPSRMRATGAGFGYNTARLLQAPLPWLTGIWIVTYGGSAAIGMSIAGGVYVIGILALALLPETRGRALPE